MKAKLFAMTASTPAPSNARTASSRDDPLPNPLSATLYPSKHHRHGSVSYSMYSHHCRASGRFFSELGSVVLEAVSTKVGVVNAWHELSGDDGVAIVGGQFVRSHERRYYSRVNVFFETLDSANDSWLVGWVACCDGLFAGKFWDLLPCDVGTHLWLLDPQRRRSSRLGRRE